MFRNNVMLFQFEGNPISSNKIDSVSIVVLFTVLSIIFIKSFLNDKKSDLDSKYLSCSSK